MLTRLLKTTSLALASAALLALFIAQAAFSSSASGAIASPQIGRGTIELSGIAQHPQFRKWQIDLLLAGDAKQAVFIATGDQAQPKLAPFTKIDTAKYPDGQHTLRLRVVYTGLQYDEYFAPLVIANSADISFADANLSDNTPLDPLAPAPLAIGGSFTPTIAGVRGRWTETGQYTVTLPISRDSTVEDILAAQQYDVAYWDTSVPAGVHWIEVDLSEQTLTAYQGNTPVLKTIISSGKDNTKLDYTLTVTGRYRIQRKIDIQRMRGRDYDTPNVPYVMYFFRGFAIHGAYWHNEFGTRVSHGCINMRIEEARQLYEWTELGTEIIIHE